MGNRPRRRPGSLRAFTCAALGLWSAGAVAEPLVAERGFPVEGACYGRVYDAAHLGRHAGQVVAGMHLWGSSRSLVADRRFAGRIEPELALTMRITPRDGRPLQGEVGCTEERGRIARCGRLASCGGDFAVDVLPDGRLRVVNDDAGSRDPTSVRARPGFSVDGGCPTAGRAGTFVPPDAENRTFLLARLPMASCIGAEPRR